MIASASPEGGGGRRTGREKTREGGREREGQRVNEIGREAKGEEERAGESINSIIFFWGKNIVQRRI